MLGNSKSGEGNFMGVRFPLPAPSNLFICNMLQGREVLEENPSGQIRTLRIQPIFNCLPYSKYGSGTAIYMHCHLYIDCPNIPLFTECAADKWSA
jgi:hypothetical protein